MFFHSNLFTLMASGGIGSNARPAAIEPTLRRRAYQFIFCRLWAFERTNENNCYEYFVVRGRYACALCARPPNHLHCPLIWQLFRNHIEWLANVECPYHQHDRYVMLHDREWHTGGELSDSALICYVKLILVWFRQQIPILLSPDAWHNDTSVMLMKWAPWPRQWDLFIH